MIISPDGQMIPATQMYKTVTFFKILPFTAQSAPIALNIYNKLRVSKEAFLEKKKYIRQIHRDGSVQVG